MLPTYHDERKPVLPLSPAPELLTADEVGRQLRLGRDAILQLVKEGKLRSAYVGRQYLFSPASVADYVQSCIGLRKR